MFPTPRVPFWMATTVVQPYLDLELYRRGLLCASSSSSLSESDSSSESDSDDEIEAFLREWRPADLVGPNFALPPEPANVAAVALPSLALM